MIRRLWPLAVVVLVASVHTSGQAPQPASAAFQAIRTNALADLKAIAASDSLNARDAQGLTPLVQAAAFGTPDAVGLLLDAGANPNQAGALGLTPLHVAVRDIRKVRLLLERGASVNALSEAGYTPLMVAAITNGSEDVVRLLLERGANVDTAENTGLTALIGAVFADNAGAAKLLLAAGANPSARSTNGAVSTPLIGAAANGNALLTRFLLGAKADVHAVAADNAAIVKNGPVLFGRVTALHTAQTGHNPEVVRLLLDAGAMVDARDVRGMTPLMIAVASDHRDIASIRLLRSHGADPDIKSAIGETTLDWARKFNDPDVLREFKLAPTRVAGSSADSRAPLPEVRNIVERGLTLIQTTAARVTTDGGCIACHAQPITAIATTLADANGFHGTGPATAASQATTALNATLGVLLQPRFTGGSPDPQLYTGTMMATQKAPPSLTTDALVYFLLALQREAGNWHGISATRAPIQDGDMTRTAFAVRVLTAYRTPALNDEVNSRITRATSWIDRQVPVSTEDAAMQLLGLTWGGADKTSRERRARSLVAEQRSDGGWAQTPNLPSDAYATGQALYALHESHVPVAPQVFAKGAAFLLRTQQPDGSWHVVNRAMKIQPYFESGFPYGHDQWVSHAGTAWAVIGLSTAGPSTSKAPPLD